MSYSNEVSPSREYEITMTDFDSSDQFVVHVTLPANLPNTTFYVGAWYDKYVPKGMTITDIVPFVEAEEKEPEYVGYGDDLDYVGPDEEDSDGFSIVLEDEEDPKEEV